MEKTCSQCSEAFTVRDEDSAFYDRVSPVIAGKKFAVPAPSQCPSCRSRRRLARRNERSLFRTTCAKTGKNVLSIYHPDTPVIVWAVEEWWSDAYDPKQYGRDFDFTKTFHENFDALSRTVPRLALHVMANENSDYVNQSGFSKNCYLCFNTDYCEDCLHCTNVIRSKNCVDTINAEQCELCYECMDIHSCYSCSYCRNCKNCSDLLFSQNMQACKNCFGCINLRNKEYCFYNEQLSADEYRKKISEIDLTSYSSLKHIQKQVEQHFLKHPRKNLEILQSENCVGDNINNCKDAHLCFDCFSDETIAYCSITSNCKDSQDGDTGGYESELCYEMVSSGLNNYHCILGSNYWGGCRDSYYCEILGQSHDCFGCICLKNAEYCILNKQYTKEEYEALLPKIIEHMQKTGEWGEFFPVNYSLFAYNQSVAQDYFPLSKAEVLQNGWSWRDQTEETPSVQKLVRAEDLPDSISNVPEDILQSAIECVASRKPFKLPKQELDFYQSRGIPLPRLHPNERHRLRMAHRNPRKLWDRECANCKKEIKTTYSPARPEIVFCEKCYLETVY